MGNRKEHRHFLGGNNIDAITSRESQRVVGGPFNRSFDVGMHNGSVVGAFEWDTYGYFVGCNKLGGSKPEKNTTAPDVLCNFFY